MSLTLPYEGEHADGCYAVTIDPQFHVVIDDTTLLPGADHVTEVQLASLAECEQLLAELDDDDGDLMYEANAIVGKYPELHKFRP